MSYKNRVLGLDVARSAAIVLVLIAHYSLFLNGRININPVLYGVGYFGVELFFALSGFLIGGIVIRNILGHSDWRVVGNFWIRRWMRTIPAYFLVLIVLGIKTHAALSVWLVFSFFLQDFTHHIRDSFFGVAWSLAIEEWFYLLLPVALLILGAKTRVKPRTLVVGLCIGGIIGCVVARYGEVMIFHTAWMDIRKSVFQRMDALLFGVLLASGKHYWPVLYRTVLNRYGLLIGLAGIAGWVIFFLPFFGHQTRLETVFNRTLMFSVVSGCSALIVAWLDTSPTFNEKIAGSIWAVVATFISVTSYAIYLIHWDVLMIGLNHKGHGIARAAGIPIITLIATYVLAAAIHYFYEKPIMDLRNRIPVSAAVPSAS